MALKHYYKYNQQLFELNKEFFDSLIKDFANNKGLIFIPAELKKPDRYAEKINSDYEGDFSKISDVVRNTILFPDVKSINEFEGYLKNRFGKNLVKIKNSYRNKRISTTKFGFASLNAKIKLPFGDIVEVQANISEMFYANHSTEKCRQTLGIEKFNEIKNRSGVEPGLGHKFYEEVRAIHTKQLKNQELSAEEFAKLEKGINLSNIYYKSLLNF